MQAPPKNGLCTLITLTFVVVCNAQDLTNFNPFNLPKATEAQCVDYCSGPSQEDRGICPARTRGGMLQWCPGTFTDVTDCMAQCREFLSDPETAIYFEEPWDASNTIECRLRALDRMRDLGASPLLSCPRAQPAEGGGFCTSRVIRDTSSNELVPNPGFTAISNDVVLYDIFVAGNVFPTSIITAIWLGDQRTRMQSNNLFDPYTPAERAQLRQQLNIDCEGNNQIKYRTVDGRCNHLCRTTEGMSFSRFGRQIRTDLFTKMKDYAVDEPPLPDVAKILPRLKNRGFIPSALLNLLGCAWLQFMNHDWFNHQTDADNCIDIPMPDGSTFCVHPTMRDSTGATINTETHWWDASTLYGSTDTAQTRVRTFRRGKLVSRLVNGKEYIARDSDGPITGMHENWWIGLEIMHTLFIREHNWICEQLIAAEFPRLDFTSDDEWDEVIFQTARLIVSAQLAKYHTIDWTPAVLFQEAISIGLYTNWYGIEETIDRYKKWANLGDIDVDQYLPIPLAVFSSNRGLDGVGGGDVDHVAFSMTEEFVGAYRMHHLLPDFVNIKGKTMSVADLYFEGSEQSMLRDGLSDWIKSFGANRAGSLEHMNFPDSLMNLDLPDGRVLNMAEVDIFRDRERGLPRYVEWKRSLQWTHEQLGENITDFSQINPDPEIQEMLSDLYDGDVFKVDLMVGLMAETTRPSGYGFSGSSFAEFLLFASRRLWADRFFRGASYNAETYTAWGIAHIESSTLKSVILRHCPDLNQFLHPVDYREDVGFTRATVFHPWPNVEEEQRQNPHFRAQCDVLNGCAQPNSNSNEQQQPQNIEWNIHFNKYSKNVEGSTPHPDMKPHTCEDVDMEDEPGNISL